MVSSGFPSAGSSLPWALIPVTAILTVIGTRRVSSGYIKTLRGEYEQQLAEKQSKADKDTENFKQQWINLSKKFAAATQENQVLQSRAEAALQENKVLQQQLNMLKEQLHSSK